MKMLDRTKKTGPPSGESWRITAERVTRATAGLEEGGLRLRRDLLADDEAAELVALTSEARDGDSFALTRLGRRASRWEALVGKASGQPTVFDDRRDMSRLVNEARALRRSTARRAFSRAEERGLLHEIGEHLAGGFMWPSQAGLLLVVLASLERGESFAPRSRIDVDGDERCLVVDARYGIGSNRMNVNGHLHSWSADLDHLAANAWLVVEKSGSQWRIRLGPRSVRAMRNAATT